MRDPSFQLSEDEIKDLIAKSAEAKGKAYAPYSNFRVGAALLTEKGDTFTGYDDYGTLSYNIVGVWGEKFWAVVVASHLD